MNHIIVGVGRALWVHVAQPLLQQGQPAQGAQHFPCWTSCHRCHPDPLSFYLDPPRPLLVLWMPLTALQHGERSAPASLLPLLAGLGPGLLLREGSHVGPACWGARCLRTVSLVGDPAGCGDATAVPFCGKDRELQPFFRLLCANHAGLPWAGELQAEILVRAERWQMPTERGGKKGLKHRGRDEATASRCLGLKSRSPISAGGVGFENRHGCANKAKQRIKE